MLHATLQFNIYKKATDSVIKNQKQFKPKKKKKGTKDM
jgi:hypothetical protein